MGAAQNQGVYSVLDIQHPQLRNFRGITKDNQNFMVASLATQKPQLYQWKNQVKQFRDNVADTESILLPIKHHYDEGGVCSTTGQVSIEYQYFPKLLSAQIRDRMRSKKKFTQAQLWYLLFMIASAREALISQGHQVGDLQPRNIFLNAEQKVKVGCKLSWPCQVSAYRKVVLEQGLGYLSPEDIVRFKLGAMDNKENTQSQIFSMGLTMLSASVLQPMKDLYSVKQTSIDEELFNTRLSLFQQDKSYSQIYRAVISNMLEMDPEQRMTQEELGQFLFKHKDNLEEKKPLMFDNVGRKLQQSINAIVKKSNGGVSDANSRYSVSSLYAVSRQNTVKGQESPHEDIGHEKELKKMRQSGPNSQNVINYELKKQEQKNVVSPRAQIRNAQSQPGSPPENGSIKETPPKPVTPPQESPVKPEIVTPSWNTPNNTPMKPPPSQPMNTNSQRGPPFSGQGYPIGATEFPPSNVPVMNQQQLNGRPVLYQQVHPGRPVSNVTFNNGSGVSFNKQPTNVVYHHVPGEVTPPQPITPLYAQPQPQYRPSSQSKYQPQAIYNGQIQPQYRPPSSHQPEPQPHRIVSSSTKKVEMPPAYNPFQNTSQNRLTFGPTQPNQKAVEESRANEDKQINNLLIDTKKGNFVEMSEVKRKDKKSPQNSQLQPQQQAQILNALAQGPPKEVESKVQQNEGEPWVEIQAAKIDQNEQPAPKGQSAQEQAEKKKTSAQQSQTEKLNELMKDAQREIEACQLSQKMKEGGNKIEEQANKLKEEGKKMTEKLTQQAQKVTEEVKKNIEDKRQNIQAEEKPGPKIKVWGVQKGKLTIQAVNDNKPKENQTFVQGVKQLKVAPTSVIIKKKEENVAQPVVPKIEQSKAEEPNKEESKAEVAKTEEPKVQEPKAEPKIEEPKAEQPKVEEQKAEEPKVESPNVEVEAVQQPIVEQAEPKQKKQYEDKKQQEEKNPEKEQLEPNKKEDNYILIEQPSKSTEKESEVQQEVNKQFIFSNKTTNGSYQQCWSQLLKMTVRPEDYCSLIDPSKVKPCQNSYGQFIKVGPATMMIHHNEQQGKLMLQNLPSSKCEGDFFMGVNRQKDGRHSAWINSSLKYKGKHFPSTEVVEQALTTLQRNVDALQ